MNDVFRVVQIKDQKEIHRSIDLDSACVEWVKRPNELKIEQLPTGSTTPGKGISTAECCATLRKWLVINKNLSEEERADMTQLIQEACGNLR